MAITGSGTPEDPWVPTTWDEFVEIFTSNLSKYHRKNYISIPEGTVWDMNELYPKGVEQITTNNSDKGYIIYGNNAIIKNLYSRGDYLFNWQVVAGSYTPENEIFHMYDMHFENLHLDGGFFTISYISDYSHASRAYFYGCTFSGISNAYDDKAPGIFVAQCTDRPRLSYFTFDVSPYTNHGCGFNMEGINTALFYIQGHMYKRDILFNINYAHIIYNGQYFCEKNNSTSGNVGDMYFLGCYIEGSCRLGSESCFIQGNTSIFDAKTTRVYSNISSDALMIINTDKFTNTGSGIPSGWKRVTTTQLQDAAFLRSLGFPIAVNGS